MNESCMIELGIWIGRYYIKQQNPSATKVEMEKAGIPIIIGGTIMFEEWEHETISPPDTETVKGLDVQSVRDFKDTWQNSEQESIREIKILRNTLIALFPSREQEIITAIRNSIEWTK